MSAVKERYDIAAQEYPPGAARPQRRLRRRCSVGKGTCPVLRIQFGDDVAVFTSITLCRRAAVEVRGSVPM